MWVFRWGSLCETCFTLAGGGRLTFYHGGPQGTPSRGPMREIPRQPHFKNRQRSLGVPQWTQVGLLPAVTLWNLFPFRQGPPCVSLRWAARDAAEGPRETPGGLFTGKDAGTRDIRGMVNSLRSAKSDLNFNSKSTRYQLEQAYWQKSVFLMSILQSAVFTLY